MSSLFKILEAGSNSGTPVQEQQSQHEPKRSQVGFSKILEMIEDGDERAENRIQDFNMHNEIEDDGVQFRSLMEMQEDIEADQRAMKSRPGNKGGKKKI